MADAAIGGEQWTRFRMPTIGSDGHALWPERFDLAALQSIRDGYVASGFPWMWDALYQQDPPDVLDSEWAPEYFGDHIWTATPTTRPSETSSVMAAVDKNLDVWIEADIQRRDIVRQGSDGLDWYRRFQPREWGIETVAFQKVLQGVQP